MDKQYDRDYFDRWYRHPAHRAGNALALRRKVRLAVSVAEYHLGRRLGSVLDVGCGEGAWRAPLLDLRPGIAYLGLDASEYAVARFGRSRNLRLVRFGQLAELRLTTPVDLLVCADVMHYLPTAELRRGLRGFAQLCDGVAFLEVFCAQDAIEGDMHGYLPRSAKWYRRAFARAGFVACGSHVYLARERAAHASALEKCAP